MTNTVKGRGSVKFRFWGDFSAVIGLVFDDEASARDAQAMLGKGWELVVKDELAGVRAIVDSEGLEDLKLRLKSFITVPPCNSFGCKNAEHEIDSLAHSCDWGPSFTITLPVVPTEQMSFAF